MSGSLICLTWKEPIFAVKLIELGLDQYQIALMFSIETLAFALTSFILNKFKEENKNFDVLVLLGCIIMTVAMVL